MTDRVIGGTFALETAPFEGERATPPARFLSKRNHFFCNGTSALASLLRRLAPGRVWLPSYCCVSLFVAARAAGVDIQIYPVDSKLSWDEREWIEQVLIGDAVVIIDYFGRAAETEKLEALRAGGAWLIEDATQALLNERVGENADFTVFSPRKFLGVPDGGILAPSPSVSLGEFSLEVPPTEWWLSAFNASLLRREFDRYGGVRTWFELFRQAERTAPVGSFAMSELSRTLLYDCFDYAAIRVRRQENYDRLSSELCDLAVMPPRTTDEVPIAYPIRVADRALVLQELFARDIFPPVHWRLEGFIPDKFAESHRLSREIMSLPCDHRYNSEDMQRIIDAVRKSSAR